MIEGDFYDFGELDCSGADEIDIFCSQGALHFNA
jgi:hypothetical protein